MKPTKENTMEAIYLQSMTDFVLKIDVIVKQPEDQDTDDWSLSCFSVIENYANFLKQPLKLGFFVPCDENGNVLDPSDAFKSCEKGFVYSKAKERVLFKGFYIENFKSRSYKFSKITSDKVTVAFWNEISLWAMENKFKNIESLASCKLELTQTAIKQIGL